MRLGVGRLGRRFGAGGGQRGAGVLTLRRLRGKPWENAGHGAVGHRRVRRGEGGEGCPPGAGCGESLGKMWGMEPWGIDV